jgi:Fic family protein
VLYLSRYIIRNKADYYRLLQSTRDTSDWEPWILYMLEVIELTSRQIIFIQYLLNNLFRYPYTKIESVQNDLRVSRLTAVKYLELMTEKGFIEKHKIGRYNCYVNRPLMSVFMEIPVDFEAPRMVSRR